MPELFGDFELDREAFELRRRGVPVPMEPQVFEVLALLVANAGRLVPKEELLDAVWGDRFVSESALTSRVKAARRALGDDGRAQRFVRTVHGRGYRFVADVEHHGREQPDAVVERPGPPAYDLPAERTPLVGRDGDIAAVVALVREHRLVTLLGFGGAGKTRLATAVARTSLDQYPDGTWFVDLVPTSDERSIATGIARSAGLTMPPGDPVQALAALLGDRAALFVLDNCEHVRTPVAAVLDHLLGRNGACHFLATSREPIDLPDEYRFVVGTLAVEADAGTPPAVELLLSSAQRFGVRVADVERSAARALCARVDGLPLAIELAAAQLRIFSCEELVARLDERFQLLAGGPAPGRSRHASLVSVLEDTWASAGSDELDLLTTLATLAGPFGLGDVEELAGDGSRDPPAVLLGHLVDRSLVVREPCEPPRYRLLESVRLFAVQECSDQRLRELADRHARWCQEKVGDDLSRHLYDFHLAGWCLAHERELRAAERHLVDTGRPGRAAHLTTAMGLALHVDMGSFAAEMLDRVEAHLSRVEDPRLRARLHLTGVMAGMAMRAPATIAEHGAAGLSEARASGDPAVLAAALVLGSWATVLRDPEEALRMVDQARDLAEAAGDRRAIDLAESYRSFHLALLRRYDEAVAQAEAVIARLPRGGPEDQAGQVAVTAWTSFTLLADPAGATRWLEQLVTLPSPRYVMWGNQVLAASVQAANGQARSALQLVQRAQDRLTRAGREGLPDLLVPAAVLAHERGRDELAARWVRAVRDAGRPTQSFHVTCVYRRLREAVGISGRSPLEGRTLEEIGAEALGWMRQQAGAENSSGPSVAAQVT